MIRYVLYLRSLAAAGEAAIELGLVVVVWQATHSGLALGGMLAIPWMASLISQGLAPLWIDRVERLVVMQWANRLRTILAAIAGIVLIDLNTGIVIELLAILLAGIAMSQNAHNDAFQALTPTIAQAAPFDLRTLVSRIQMAESLAAGGIYASGALWLLGGGSPAMLWAIAAGAFGLAGIMRLPRQTPVSAASAPSVPLTGRSDPGAYRVIGTFWRDQPIVLMWTLISVVLAGAFVGANVLLAPALSQLWGVSVARGYGWVLLAIAVGGVFGGKIVDNRRWNRLVLARQVQIAVSSLGLIFIAASLVHHVLSALGLLILSGIAAALMARAVALTIQAAAPEAIRGRVMAIRALGMLLGAGVGSVIAGMFVQWAGPQVALMGWGLGLMGLGISVPLIQRRIIIFI